nr:MAG TPA: hypothetical protein [Bacteriophage sp.]DAO38671.1 MAG TPA: hypothetical protein [Caudoviricetes sp.]DAP68028.1 MAG TPA: hypothetical protein [Caudoviricetes sp.]DAU98496.1 MAG TPA: hypothetical protein [Caudoviricetes sp.]
MGKNDNGTTLLEIVALLKFGGYHRYFRCL